MVRRGVTWVVAGLLVGVVACSNPNLGRAKRARYDVDPTLVFQGALDAPQERYADLEADRELRVIETAWHQVGTGPSDVGFTRQVRTNMQGGTARIPTTARTRLFVRFEVKVVGERPYTVEVVGYASERSPGNRYATRLAGAARPGWLDERIDGLRAAIYERLAKHAVLAPEPVDAQ